MGFIVKNNYDGNFLVLCPGFIFNKSHVAFVFSRFFFTADSNFSTSGTRAKCKFAPCVIATYFVFPVLYKEDLSSRLKDLDGLQPDTPPTTILAGYHKPYFNVNFQARDFIDPALSYKIVCATAIILASMHKHKSLAKVCRLFNRKLFTT